MISVLVIAVKIVHTNSQLLYYQSCYLRSRPRLHGIQQTNPKCRHYKIPASLDFSSTPPPNFLNPTTHEPPRSVPLHSKRGAQPNVKCPYPRRKCGQAAYSLSSYSLSGAGSGLSPFRFLVSNMMTLDWFPGCIGSEDMVSQ